MDAVTVTLWVEGNNCDAYSLPDAPRNQQDLPDTGLDMTDLNAKQASI